MLLIKYYASAKYAVYPEYPSISLEVCAFIAFEKYKDPINYILLMYCLYADDIQIYVFYLYFIPEITIWVNDKSVFPVDWGKKNSKSSLMYCFLFYLISSVLDNTIGFDLGIYLEFGYF